LTVQNEYARSSFAVSVGLTLKLASDPAGPDLSARRPSFTRARAGAAETAASFLPLKHAGHREGTPPS
jgi:hypothetical protein